MAARSAVMRWRIVSPPHRPHASPRPHPASHQSSSNGSASGSGCRSGFGEGRQSERRGITMTNDVTKPTRIWYQSFVDPEEQAPYLDRLRERLRRHAAPGVTVDVFGVTPPDRFFHPLTEFRCADQAIRNALAAERQGYDAFVIGHFQEPGLTECRGALDIPVIGLGEAAMLFACQVGRRFALVTIDPVFVPWHEEQVIRHGLDRRCAGISAIKADLPRFMRAFADAGERQRMREDFARQVEPLVARGADVVIAAGGL